MNFVKEPPPKVAIKMPSATAVEENTPMTVSLARLVRRRTAVNSKASSAAKITAPHSGSPRPQIAPTATPVKAEWPSASEKKDIRRVTTMVDRMPNRGETTSRASSAFFIKYMEPSAAHSKGSSSTMEYQRFMPAPPFGRQDERPGEIPRCPAPRRGCRSTIPSP